MDRVLFLLLWGLYKKRCSVYGASSMFEEVITRMQNLLQIQFEA